MQSVKARVFADEAEVIDGFEAVRFAQMSGRHQAAEDVA
jgi:hypothetical protein